MNKFIKKSFLLTAVCLCTAQANAQLSSNPDKFLGNITTRGQVEAGRSVLL